MNKMFHHWQLFVPLQRAENKRAQRVEALYSKSVRVKLVVAVNRWHGMARRQKRLRVTSLSLILRSQKVKSRRVFCTWRGAWAQKLLWHSKDARIEQSRITTLAGLRDEEASALARERDSLKGESKALGEELRQLQRRVDDQQSAILDSANALEKKRTEKEVGNPSNTPIHQFVCLLFKVIYREHLLTLIFIFLNKLNKGVGA